MKNRSLFCVMLVLWTGWAFGQSGVSINESGAQADPSAMLEIESSTKGMLIPRMTSAERMAIPTPAEGLLLYDTDSRSFWFFKAGSWAEISAGGSAGLPTEIADADKDTKVEVEGSPDEDMIRFSVDSMEKMVMQNNSAGDLTLQIYSSNQNLYMGENAGGSIDSLGNSASNTFIGNGAGESLQNGFENTFIGADAGRNSTTGGRNTFIGHNAGLNTTTGVSNVYIGEGAGYFNPTGSNNVYIGQIAGFSGGASNELIISAGFSSEPLIYGQFDSAMFRINGTLDINDAFQFPTVDGDTNQVLVSNGSGKLEWQNSVANFIEDADGDTKIEVEKTLDEDVIRFSLEGSQKMVFTQNTDGQSRLEFPGTTNVAVGENALLSNTSGSSNTVVGRDAGEANTTGFENSFFGYKAGEANTTGLGNSFFGRRAGLNTTTGFWNTIIGKDAGIDNTTGSANTFVGERAAVENTTGIGNVAVGQFAGYYARAGNNNTFIGRSAGDAVAMDSVVNVTALGHNAIPSGSNTIRFGNSAITSISGFAPFTDLSDGRFKTNVNENVAGLDFIGKLRPVTYHVNAQKLSRALGEKDMDAASLEAKSQIVYTGFIAQEVEAAAQELGFDFSGVKTPQNADDQYGLRYAQFVVPLVKAVQEQQAIIESLEQRIAQLEKAAQ